ncbi:MAG TPA: histidine kinase [Ktedonobacteraceae bacterium]|nr:histidine kinase [Ktedonobacteraceae bacterium]
MSHQQTRSRHIGTILSPDAPGHSAEGIASSGVTFHLWRLYQYAWLVCLFFPLASVVTRPISFWQGAVRGLALLGFALGYTWLMWPHPASQQTRARTHPQRSLVLFGVLCVLVLVFSLTDGPAWLWLCIGVSAIAGMLLPMRQAFAAIVLLTLLPLFLTLMAHGGLAGIDWWWLIALLLLVRGIGLDMIGVARMGSAIRELHLARQALARLAVIEERERLSRDLHDLLGQALSMITLKSELAGCLVKEEPERCMQELAEIERVSRQTLREVREAVADYRQPNLLQELEGARHLLEAAGITVQIETLNAPLPPAFDAVLAWTVREGVTNVIRHSRAQQCRICLIQRNGTIGAEVLNDDSACRSEEQTPGRGLGLVGLRERVAVLGGSLEASPLVLQGKEHFRLSVELPFSDQGEAAAFQKE